MVVSLIRQPWELKDSVSRNFKDLTDTSLNTSGLDSHSGKHWSSFLQALGVYFSEWQICIIHSLFFSHRLVLHICYQESQCKWILRVYRSVRKTFCSYQGISSTMKTISTSLQVLETFCSSWMWCTGCFPEKHHGLSPRCWTYPVAQPFWGCVGPSCPALSAHLSPVPTPASGHACCHFPPV